MKEWISEILLATITAIVVTLLSYALLEHSWIEASQTGFAAFTAMFLMGAYGIYKRKKKQK